MAQSLKKSSTPQAEAFLRVLRATPRKVELVLGLIRGQKVEIALNRLKFCKKKAALDVFKLLRSAIANAENNHGMDIDELYVSEAWSGLSFMMKRFDPRAKGRASRIHKCVSNVRLILREKS